MSKKHKYEAIKEYINYDDLLNQLGYKHYTPRIGVLGRALLKASNNQRSNSVLKKYWDSYFKKLRQEKRNKEHNKHNDVSKQNG